MRLSPFRSQASIIDVMRNTPVYIVVFALLSLALTLPGCSQQTLDSAKQDTQRNLQSAKPQLAKLELGSRVTAALQSADVHGVRVDADTDGVSLHGTVNSAAQKARAGRIARDTLGPGKTVKNDIRVSGE